MVYCEPALVYCPCCIDLQLYRAVAMVDVLMEVANLLFSCGGGGGRRDDTPDMCKCNFVDKSHCFFLNDIYACMRVKSAMVDVAI